MECFVNRHICNICIPQVALDMRKPNPKKGGKYVSVVGEDAPKPRLPHRACAQFFEAVDGAEVEDCDHGAHEACCGGGCTELINKLFYALNY